MLKGELQHLKDVAKNIQENFKDQLKISIENTEQVGMLLYVYLTSEIQLEM